MSRIMEEVVAEYKQKLIQAHRADGLDDETIARYIREPLEYVKSIPPLAKAEH